MKLGQASTGEINAAFDKVYPELLNLAHYYSGMVNVPFINVEAMIRQQMETPEFKRRAVQIIDDALNAAEDYRKANA